MFCMVIHPRACGGNLRYGSSRFRMSGPSGRQWWMIPEKKGLDEFLDGVLRALLDVDAQGPDRLEDHDIHVRL